MGNSIPERINCEDCEYISDGLANGELRVSLQAGDIAREAIYGAW